MKRLPLLILAVLFSISLNGQKLSTNEVDEFTGSVILHTSFFEGESMKKSDKITVEGSVYVSTGYLKTTDNIEYYSINLALMGVGDLGCMSEYDGKAIFLFEDGSKITLKQMSDTDCDESVYDVSYYTVTPEQADAATWKQDMLENADLFKTKPIQKIRVYGSEYYKDFELLPEKRDIIIKHLALIEQNISN